MTHNQSAPIVPILSKAVESSKVKGVYVMREKVEVGRIYRMVCPGCNKTLVVKAKEAKPFIETCCYCGTKTMITGQERLRKVENEEAGETKPETQKVSTHNQNVHTSGRIVWGNLLWRKSYVLHEGANYIGRNDSEIPSDITIDDEYVSRRSILIEVAAVSKGFTYKLTVKKCTNPVLINGKEYAVDDSVYLNYGDTILVGNTTLTFKPVK